MLMDHSKRCKTIIDKHRELIEINNWLLEKCKEASILKDTLKFEGMTRNQSIKNTNSKKLPVDSNNPGKT